MELNDFDVIVCTPTEICIMLEVLRKQSVIALQDCDEDGADVICHAWQGKYEMMQAEVCDHFPHVVGVPPEEAELGHECGKEKEFTLKCTTCRTERKAMGTIGNPPAQFCCGKSMRIK